MRLTFWNDRKGHFDWHCENNEIADKLAAYEDTGLTPEEFKESVDFVLELNKKLKPYMDAEKDGRLVMLPCKVEDTVYCIFEDEDDIFCGTVYAISTCDGVNWFSARYNTGLRYDHRWDAIGKTVFLTREEAEVALKGRQDDV